MQNFILAYLSPKIGDFLKRRRKKKLGKDVRAKEAFDRDIEYYLRQPYGRIEALLELILIKQGFWTGIVVNCYFIIITVFTLWLEIIWIALIATIGVGIYLAKSFVDYRRVLYQTQICSEVNRRLTEEEPWKFPK